VFWTPGVRLAAATIVRLVGSLSMRSALRFVATAAFWVNSPGASPTTSTVSLTVLTASVGFRVTLSDGETCVVCLTVRKPASVNVTV
jgi:hypothetical protein